MNLSLKLRKLKFKSYLIVDGAARHWGSLLGAADNLLRTTRTSRRGWLRTWCHRESTLDGLHIEFCAACWVKTLLAALTTAAGLTAHHLLLHHHHLLLWGHLCALWLNGIFHTELALDMEKLDVKKTLILDEHLDSAVKGGNLTA